MVYLAIAFNMLFGNNHPINFLATFQISISLMDVFTDCFSTTYVACVTVTLILNMA